MAAQPGRPRKFESPEELWELCSEYFQWVEDNPLYEMKAFAFQGVVTQEPVAKMRAMTLNALTLYLGISDETWRLYKTREEFIGVISQCEKCIYDQKFSGAAADLLNANIISRDLGLMDKSQLDISNPDGSLTRPLIIQLTAPDDKSGADSED
jgi:hypothetical protein